MGTKLFVSNLDFEIENQQLEEMFTAIGPSISVVIAKDRETKRSKGFAFVEMERDEDAQAAIDKLNNQVNNGRPIKVSPTGAKLVNMQAVDQAPKVPARNRDARCYPRYNACSCSRNGES